MRTIHVTLVLAASLVGCQPSVEGWWKGEIGAAPRTLRLAQTGSAVDGEICSPEVCEPLHGAMDEDWLELDFGCSTCNMPETQLHLQLTDQGLAGDASEVGCACPSAPAPCTCSTRARFNPCDGPC
jgi:hypothetical protein